MCRRGHEWQRCLWEVLLLHQGAAWPPHTPSPDLSCGHSLHMVYMPCTHIMLIHIAHTISQVHKHTLHICSQSSSWSGNRPFFNTSKRKTENEISLASIFGISADSAVGQRKLGFFLIIRPQLMHDPKIKFYLITANFTVPLPVTTKQIRKLGVIVGQFSHHKWVGKLKQEPLVQSRAASPSPIDEAGQGTT